MRGKPGNVVEQVTGVEPERCIRYRVIEGGPLRHHNGEVVLLPSQEGCEVRWTIRFGSKYPLVGPLLRRVMQKMLDQILHTGLKPFAERAANSHRSSRSATSRVEQFPTEQSERTI